MAFTANSLIEDVSRYLSDYGEDDSYAHWTKEDLLSYFKYAVGIVVRTRKDKFIKRTTVDLVPGAIQEVPDSCQSDITMLGMQDDEGAISRVRRATLGSFVGLGRPMCKSKVKSSTYKMNSYDFEAGNERVIIVDPPVPESASGKLVLTCYQPPEITSTDSVIDLDVDSETAVFELMLYYAWGVDIEDSATRERSNQHWANAMHLLKIDLETSKLLQRGRR